jgi:3',5'-cyclic AMP phosphodiesterase CpdA
MLLAHLSDLHLDDGPRAAERTNRVLAYLDGLRQYPDAVLVTGDLADHGAEAEYEQLLELLGERALLMCPGNHDRRGPYRKVLLGAPASDEPIDAVHDLPGARIVLLDSSIPGRDDGYLADESLEVLAQALAETPPERAVLVAFHHPPADLHVPFIDDIRLHGEQRLAALLAHHPNVVAVLCGHAHTPAASHFAGRPLLVAPGVVSTLHLPWETAEIVDEQRPPALAFHVIDADRRVTTHYRLVV